MENYGVTQLGGANDLGTIFEITPGGVLTTIHSFDGTHGSNPGGPLMLATDGNLYGHTQDYFPNGDAGEIFRITPSGSFSVVHILNATDGAVSGALLQSTDGNLYGTTAFGQADYGSVFRFSVGLDPFVKTLPTSGNVGAAITILGTNLIGATSVTFNGTAAAFNVVSVSEISATVPAGASTGPVQVVTPAVTLSTYGSFTVRP